MPPIDQPGPTVGPGHGGFPRMHEVGGGDVRWIHDLAALGMLIVLIVGLILVIRMIINRPRAPLTTGPVLNGAALAELDFRYARGEVERDDFLQRRADLQHPHGPSAAPATGPGAAPDAPVPSATT